MEPRQGASRARRQGRGGRAGSGRQLRCAPLRARTLAAAGGGRRAGPSHGGFRRPEPRCSFNTGRWMETDERRLVPARGLGLERGWGRHGRGGLRSGLADAAHPGAAPGRAAAALGRAMTARRSAPARGAAQRRRARARVSRTLRERRPQSLGLGETPRSGASGAAPPAARTWRAAAHTARTRVARRAAPARLRTHRPRLAAAAPRYADSSLHSPTSSAHAGRRAPDPGFKAAPLRCRFSAA